MSGEAFQTHESGSSSGVASAACRSADPAHEIGVLQDRVARLEVELVTCQRLATLGNMAAVVAHEFNNLMTAVLARSQDALSRDDVPAMRKALDRTVTNSQKAVAITQHLMGFAGAVEVPLEACSVAAAVHEAIDTTTRPFDKDTIELCITVDEGLCVHARRILLEQVLLNLLLNARKAIGRNGVISVSARREGDAVQIDICDTGHGFTQDELDSRINPYLAAEAGTASSWQPAGFGLNTCRVIAHRHGASIQAFANETEGCTFRLQWPAVPAAS